MKVIYVPGFWDSPDKFEVLAKIFKEQNIEYKILDYRSYKKFGKTLNQETFSKMLSELDGDEFKDSIIMSYSMGASFVYDFLALTNIKPAKLIFINPLIEKVGNPIAASYYRVMDMYLQKQLFKAITTAHKGLFPLMDIALLQQNYNKNIKFDKKLDVDATFVWSDRDLICPIRNYDKYKNLFKETNLITVPKYHHNWLVYEWPVLEYLLEQVVV